MNEFKMLMIIADDKYRDAIEDVLESHKVRGFSEIPTVYGEGGSGKRLGSPLHPGASSIIFTIVLSERVEEFKTALMGACSLEQGCERPVHIAILGVEEFV